MLGRDAREVSREIHVKRREKSVKKTVLIKRSSIVLFCSPAQSKESPFVFLKAPSSEGMPKRDRGREREREISNTGLRLNCLPRTAKVELLEESFFTLSFGNEKTNRGERMLLENFIRIIRTHFAPRERTHLITTN